MNGEDCGRIRPEIVAWLDGELGGDAARAVEEHVTSCAACRRERALLEATGALLGAAPAGPGPLEGFEARLRARIAGEGKVLALRRRGRFTRIAAAAAIAASVALFGTGIALRLGLLDRGGARPGAGSGTGGSIGAVPPQVEEQVIAKLDVLENLDVVENLDLLEAYEGPEDPAQGLDEGGRG
jgi:hypothetical protein